MKKLIYLLCLFFILSGCSVKSNNEDDEISTNSQDNTNQEVSLEETNTNEKNYINNYYGKDKNKIYANFMYDDDHPAENPAGIVYTENGQISFHIPYSIREVQNDGNKLQFSINNDWISIDFIYEIVDDISNPVECEKRINSILNTLPALTYDRPEWSNFKRYDQDQSPWSEYNCYKSNDGYKDFYSCRWKQVNDYGAAYVYESSKDFQMKDENNFNSNSFKYCKIVSESYNNIDEVTLHCLIQINRIDYAKVYNSFETQIEKNSLENEMNLLISELNGRIYCYEYSNGEYNYGGYTQIGYNQNENMNSGGPAHIIELESLDYFAFNLELYCSYIDSDNLN